jgi:hypothetical protein
MAFGFKSQLFSFPKLHNKIKIVLFSIIIITTIVLTFRLHARTTIELKKKKENLDFPDIWFVFLS